MTTSIRHGRIEAEISRRIASVGLVAALLVVSIHINWDAAGDPLSQWINKWVKYGIAQMAVPYFFVAAGYFLSRHFGEERWYLRALAKRVKSLIIPFLIWCVLGLLISTMLSCAADLLHHRSLFTNHILRRESLVAVLGLDFSAMPILPQLWFVRSLCVCIILSPLISLFSSTSAGKIFLGMAAFIVLICGVFVSIPAWATISGLAYFTIGCILPDCFLNFGRNGYLMATAFLSVGLMCPISPKINIMSLAVPLFIMGAWSLSKFVNVPQIIAKQAFPCYLIHYSIIGICYTIYEAVLGTPNVGAHICLFCFSASASVASGIYLADKAPGLARVLFGGRGQ